MIVPWSGFPLKALVDFCKPVNNPKYVVMKTASRHQDDAGPRRMLYPWPYAEGLAMDEAMNDLAFIATGLYGKPIPKQNGAPLRLVAPWKYGFKSVKSIVSIEFTDKRPVSFWEKLQSERIRLLGQREPQGAASALEPGDREAARQQRAHPDPALQRLRRVGRRAVHEPQGRKAVHVTRPAFASPRRPGKTANPG